MSDTSQLHGTLAQFEDVDTLMAAAKKVRDMGYKKWDAHTPFPVHGLDDAMGIKPTILPWLVLGGGITGLCCAFLMQYWMNAVDYAYKISGKPFFALPPATPIGFEMTVLFSALTCVFGMLILNGLPKWFNPLLRNDRFKRVTDDKFFICIEAADAAYDAEKTPELLKFLGASAIESVEEPQESDTIPRPVTISLWVLTSLALLPPAYMAMARYGTSETPRIHVVPNMDWQEKYKAQNASPLFEDGRAMRPDPEGTVARGAQDPESPMMTGKDAHGAWLAEIPMEADAALMERGQERYNIYCSACHAVDGSGNGAVHQRAEVLAKNGQAIWVKPTDLREQRIIDQPFGQIYATISDGLNNMPAYRAQIPVEDRWAIAFYMKALQSAGKE